MLSNVSWRRDFDGASGLAFALDLLVKHQSHGLRKSEATLIRAVFKRRSWIVGMVANALRGPAPVQNFERLLKLLKSLGSYVPVQVMEACVRGCVGVEDEAMKAELLSLVTWWGTESAQSNSALTIKDTVLVPGDKATESEPTLDPSTATFPPLARVEAAISFTRNDPPCPGDVGRLMVTAVALHRECDQGGAMLACGVGG